MNDHGVARTYARRGPSEAYGRPQSGTRVRGEPNAYPWRRMILRRLAPVRNGLRGCVGGGLRLNVRPPPSFGQELSMFLALSKKPRRTNRTKSKRYRAKLKAKNRNRRNRVYGRA